MVELSEQTSNQMMQTRDCASGGQPAPPETNAQRFVARQKMVEGDGFEPSYAEAGRFTVMIFVSIAVSAHLQKIIITDG